MRKLLPVAAIIALLIPVSAQTQRKGGKPAAKASPSLQNLISQGKVNEAVRLASRTPQEIDGALKNIMDAADLQITERRLPDARASLQSAAKFIAAYSKTKKPIKIPGEGLRGRELRLDGIELIDRKDYAKAETTLGEALRLSKQAKDIVLEAGVHNNLGVALRYQGLAGSDTKLEEAARNFDTARSMAEEQKDSLRAGSYNFNLGHALLDLRRPAAALDAFKRSAQQNKTAGKPSLEARATMFQGVALSKINVVSPEPLKLFDQAYKMFVGQEDNQNAGWTLYLMADHMAYSMKFTEAAALAERAIPLLTTAKDNAGLIRCYTFLSDIYGRAGDKAKAEANKQKAAELKAQK
jgi:tetratricopeptide (TPR) repeat protein